jgi:hypothetical protein
MALLPISWEKVVQDLYASGVFEWEERYGLASQIRRAAVWQAVGVYFHLSSWLRLNKLYKHTGLSNLFGDGVDM